MRGNKYWMSIGTSSWTTDLCPGMPSTRMRMYSRKQCSPMPWQWWIRSAAGEKNNNGEGPDLQHVCKPCCVMNTIPRRSTWKEECYPLCKVSIGSVKMLWRNMSGHRRSFERRRSAGGVGLRNRYTMGMYLVCCSLKLNVILDVENTRIATYHEVTNLAVEAATEAPYGGRDTPRARLLWSNFWSPKDLDKKMIGCGLGESLVLLPPVPLSAEDAWNNDFGEKWCLLESLKTMSRSQSKPMHRVSLSSPVSSEGLELASKIGK